MKRKAFACLLACVMVFALFAAGCTSTDPGDPGEGVVNVYNWGEYIDESIFDDFEAQTGIKVNYNVYASNEILYSNLKNGSGNYDVIIPSDYMISRMIDEDMLEPLNFDNIPNFAKISDQYKNLAYDPTNEYSVPYTWGTVGIIYNTSVVNEPVTSWDILFNKNYAGNILMFDNPRDSIGIALKYMGNSFNTTDTDQITQAVDLLIQQKKDGIVQAYVMDQIFEKLISGEAAIGPYYAGDALTMMEENPDLAFCLPSEGSNLFVDAMCIPKGAAHKDAAEQFINFMCETDICLRNADATGYSTPSIEALEQMDEDVRNNQIAYPSAETLARCEAFANLPEDILALYDSEWTRLGIAQRG